MSLIFENSPFSINDMVCGTLSGCDGVSKSLACPNSFSWDISQTSVKYARDLAQKTSLDVEVPRVWFCNQAQGM